MAQAATMKVVIPHLLVLLLMLLPSEESDAQSFGLGALAESALSTDCLDWKIDASAFGSAARFSAVMLLRVH